MVWTKHFTTFVTYDQIDDTVAPTTTPVITGTLSSGTTYIGTTTIALNAVDNVGGVGVATTTYSLDGGAWQTYATTSPLVVTAGGDHMLQFFSTDWFGNQEATSTLNFSIITTGKLVVTKRTLGGDGTFGFMGDAGAFSVTTVAGVGSTTVSSLLPGIYSVSETATPGWTLVSSDCSQVSIVLGETTSCIVTNAKQGHIVVKVVASTTTTVFPFVASYASAGFSVGAGSQDDSGLLDPGTYAVSENIPDGWVLASSTCSDGSSVGAIVLDPGETVTCTFTNSKGIDKNNASISGVKFEDKNGNGKQDSGEKGLFGWVIYIDTNNNGRFDWGERFTITNFKGEYQLRRLSAGTYTIREVLWPGWQQMFPATGSYSVKLTVGQTVTDKDFGNFKKGRIGGTVFEDKNGNGKLDRREGSLGGWAVTLTGPDDTTKTATTDRSGRYSFSDLGPGTYTVREVLRVGWKQTTKNVSVAVIQSGTYVPDADVGVTRVK